jgi:hypothetical protein
MNYKVLNLISKKTKNNNLIIVFFFIITLSSISCEKSKQENEEPIYFITARVNDMDWKSDENSGVATLRYNSSSNTYFFDIKSQTYNPLSNGIRYQLSIGVNQSIRRGIFHFNNIALNSNLGYVTGWKTNGNEDNFSAHSINGFINITSLTKDYIGGDFEYTAVTLQTSMNSVKDTIVVSSGKFMAPFVGAIGDWNGPE